MQSALEIYRYRVAKLLSWSANYYCHDRRIIIVMVGELVLKAQNGCHPDTIIVSLP